MEATMFGNALPHLQDLYRIAGGRLGWFLARAARGDITRVLETPASFDVRWNLDYEPDFPRGERLYQTAKRCAWDPRRDIDWSIRAGRDQGLIADEHWVGHAMGLADLLDERDRVRFNRHSVGWVMSQLLHGEQGSLLLVSQLCDMRADLDGKLFLAAQAMDEARHVEAFRRYLVENDLFFPIDPNMKAVIDSMLAQRSWRKKAIGMLIVVEGYAMGVFNFMRRGTTDPLLERILTLVAQDEGRHVGFGIESIAVLARDCPAREWRDLKRYAFSLVRSLYHARERGGLRSSLDEYWRFGRDRMGLSRPAFEDRALDTAVARRFQHELFHDTLLPSLEKLGLLDGPIAGEYRNLGIVIPEKVE
jgi:hypothetical protein